MSLADLDAVLAIEQASESAPHWSRTEYLVLLENPRDGNLRRTALVAVGGATVTGFAVARSLSMPGSHEAELESIVVVESARGRGIGATLMAAVLEAVKALGAERFDLEVRASNQAAIRLYRRFGFGETGLRRGYYRAPDEDAVLMSVTL